MAARKSKAPVLELHQGTGDANTRRALYETRPAVESAELARLYRAAQRALEDLALALGPLDGLRGPIVTCAGICGSQAESIARDRRYS
jgi:hypothetical protein